MGYPPVRILALVTVTALILAGCMGAEGRKAQHLRKGEAYLAAGNTEKARIEFRNALQIAPNDSEARYENGVVAEKLGDPRTAAQFYQGAIDVQKDNVAARAALARIYIFVGQPDKALETIKPSMDKHPADARLLTVRAAARSQQKDLEGARQDAEQATKADPTSQDAVAVLAGIYRSQGDVARAQSLLEDAIKRIPDSVDLRLALAQLEANQGKDREVEAILVDVVRLRPKEKAHRLRLAQFYARDQRLDDAERVLREAVAAFPQEHDLKAALVDFLNARRSPDAAQKQLSAFIAADPKDYKLRFMQAQFYEQGKDYKQAELVYRQVIADAGLDEAGLTARNRLAALRVLQNDVPGAKKLIAEVLDKSPRDDDALVLRGNLSLNENNPRAAIADLRSVLRDQPNAVGVMRSLARAHLANGEPALAEETMRSALESNPKDQGVRLDLANLLAQLGRPEQAKPLIDEIVKDQPTNVQALDTQFKIALAAHDLVTAKAAADAITAAQPRSGLGPFEQGELAEVDHRPDDAVRLYTTALELSPTLEPVQAIARVLVNAKRVPEALKRLDDLIARDPKSPVAANVKGEVLLSQQRIAEGIESFKVAVARAPNWPVAYRNLALAQFASHDQAAAIETLQKGIAAVHAPESLEFDLAAVYEKSGRSKDAIGVYERALARTPDSDPFANNLAMLLVTYNKDPASLDRAKSLAARFASSDNPNYLDTYGWVLYKRGEAAQAVSVLQTALAKSSDSPVSLYHLGMAEALAGQTDAARDSLTRSLQAGKSFNGMEEAKATLDRLGKGAPSTARATS